MNGSVHVTDQLGDERVRLLLGHVTDRHRSFQVLANTVQPPLDGHTVPGGRTRLNHRGGLHGTVDLSLSCP